MAESVDGRQYTAQSPQSVSPSLSTPASSRRLSGPINEIEQPIGRLLRATKTLLTQLSEWSHSRVPEEICREAFSTLNINFNATNAAFQRFGVELGELKLIPSKLEACLNILFAEPPAAFQSHFPDISKIILSLVQGLRQKQDEVRYLVSNLEHFHEHQLPPQAPQITSSIQDGNGATDAEEKSRSSTQSIPIPTSPEMKNAASSFSSTSMSNSMKTIPSALDTTAKHAPFNPPSPAVLTPPPRGIFQPGREYYPGVGPSAGNFPTTPIPFHLFPDPGRAPVPTLMHPEFRHAWTGWSNNPEAVAAYHALSHGEGLQRRSSVLMKKDLYFSQPGKFAEDSRQLTTETGLDSTVTDETPERDEGKKEREMVVLSSKDSPSTSPTNANVSSVAEKTQIQPEESLEVSKGITLYLRVDKQTKKVLHEGELSISALRVHFLEKFGYTPPQGYDFPPIYIYSPDGRVSYELENVGEICNGSILSLNVDETNAQMQKAEESSYRMKMEQELASLKKSLTTNTNLLLQFAQRQQNPMYLSEGDSRHWRPVGSTMPNLNESATQTVGEDNSTAESRDTTPPATMNNARTVNKLRNHQKELREIHQQFEMLREFNYHIQCETRSTIRRIRDQVTSSQDASQAPPVSNERAEIGQVKSELILQAEYLTENLKQLMETVDAMQSATMHGLLPLPEHISEIGAKSEILEAAISVQAERIKSVKPKWRLVWEQELQTVVQDQQFLKGQETLLNDIRSDYSALCNVRHHLEQLVKAATSVKPPGENEAS
ncbi:uncharacterized protein VTP21DRAFT_11713 [Calcarisporiella thermophila]|uniref:uncharacterized protein n=1 Tax=Calcarisporiella thermophila TaxID=911321 RepID=UPI0037445FD2